LEELRDPRGRTQKMKELVDLFYGSMTSVAPYIGMSNEELKQYAQARAERTLQYQQRQAECQIDPTCNPGALLGSRQAEAKREEAELLGPEYSKRLEAFKAAFLEDSIVHVLQQALPSTSALPPAQTGKLILALHEETQKFEAEAKQSGQLLLTYISRDGVNLLSAYQPGAADEYEQRMESAARHQRKLHDRAATLLTAEQLAQLKTIQDRALANGADRIREEIIATKARKAAAQ
jgi:hypothetical protein